MDSWCPSRDSGIHRRSKRHTSGIESPLANGSTHRRTYCPSHTRRRWASRPPVALPTSWLRSRLGIRFVDLSGVVTGKEVRSPCIASIAEPRFCLSGRFAPTVAERHRTSGCNCSVWPCSYWQQLEILSPDCISSRSCQRRTRPFFSFVAGCGPTRKVQCTAGCPSPRPC